MYLENKEGRAAGAVRVNNMKKYFLKEAAREAHEEASRLEAIADNLRDSGADFFDLEAAREAAEEARRAAYKIEEAGAVFGVYGWK